MSKRMFAIATSLMMVMVAGFIVLDTDDSSAANTSSNSLGEFNIYVYVNGVWEVYNASGYNAYEAFANSAWASHCTEAKGDYIITPPGQTFQTINKDYGTIVDFNQYRNNEVDHWCTLALVKNAGTGTMEWELGHTALGWYKPFTDYAGYMPEYGTANIALYFGQESWSGDKIQTLEDTIRIDEDFKPIPLTSIDKTSGSVFEQKFRLKNAISSEYTHVVAPGTKVINGSHVKVNLYPINVIRGIDVYGYGSDSMLALIDALGNNNVSFYTPTQPVPDFKNYGWMDKMFELGTVTISSTAYDYWISYTAHTEMGDAGNVEALYATGAYSPMPNAPLTAGDMAFIYNHYRF